MRALQVARKPRQTALLLYFQGCKCAGFKYYLNGEPAEADTQINVNFTLSGG